MLVTSKVKNDLMPLLETESEHAGSRASPSRADSILEFLQLSTGESQAAQGHFLSAVALLKPVKTAETHRSKALCI